MSLLRKTRDEVAGAWRSLRYDFGRRPVEPPAGGPDVTSTGMSTFAVPVTTCTGAPVVARRPRRALTAGIFGVLTVVGAAAAYLGVVNGLGSLTQERPAAAQTLPTRPAATSKARVGEGPAPNRVVRPTSVGPTTTPAAAGAAGAVSAVGAVGAGRAPQPAVTRQPRPPVLVNPASPDCDCGNPPVPTPTAPQAPTPTPSSASPSPASPSPSESSAEPDDSDEPHESPRGRHRRHHR